MDKLERHGVVKGIYQNEQTIYIGLVQDLEDGYLYLSPAKKFGENAMRYSFIGLATELILRVYRITFKREE